MFTGEFVPRTHYEYDERGRLVSSWTDPAWDDEDRLLLNTYLDWKSDRHTCGRQLSEVLYDSTKPDPELLAIHFECLGCKAEQEFWRDKHKQWERLHEEGVHPERWTLPVIMTRAEAEAHRIRQFERQHFGR